MVKPLVSIVVPIYKVEQYLERCVDSIVAQDYQPIEVILVNDGSPDGCGEIIKRYEEKYPFVQSIWQKNSGVGAARNTGIARASGKYIALVDSDDYIEPNCISSLVNIAEKQDADIIVFSFYFEFPSGTKIPFGLLTRQKYMSGSEAARESLKLLKLPTYCWNKFYKRSLFTDHNILFPPIYYEDLATVSKVLIKAKHVALVNKPYYHYCLRKSSSTGNFGLKNIMDYLSAVDIIRQFIWSENLWGSWEKAYRDFLRAVETQLFIEINFQKNTIPPKDRRKLVQQVRQRIRELAAAPEQESDDMEENMKSEAQ